MYHYCLLVLRRCTSGSRQSAVGSEKENICTVRHLISVVWNAEGAKSEILIRNLKIQFIVPVMTKREI